MITRSLGALRVSGPWLQAGSPLGFLISSFSLLGRSGHVTHTCMCVCMCVCKKNANLTNPSSRTHWLFWCFWLWFITKSIMKRRSALKTSCEAGARPGFLWWGQGQRNCAFQKLDIIILVMNEHMRARPRLWRIQSCDFVASSLPLWLNDDSPLSIEEKEFCHGLNCRSLTLKWVMTACHPKNSGTHKQSRMHTSVQERILVLYTSWGVQSAWAAAHLLKTALLWVSDVSFNWKTCS